MSTGIQDDDATFAEARVGEVGNVSLRDRFALSALTGMMASRSPTSPRFDPDDDAKFVYQIADAMLKARSAS